MGGVPASVSGAQVPDAAPPSHTAPFPIIQIIPEVPTHLSCGLWFFATLHYVMGIRSPLGDQVRACEVIAELPSGLGKCPGGGTVGGGYLGAWKGGEAPAVSGGKRCLRGP